jgi:hypothetical protein
MKINKGKIWVWFLPDEPEIIRHEDWIKAAESGFYLTGRTGLPHLPMPCAASRQSGIRFIHEPKGPNATHVVKLTRSLNTDR